MAVGSKNVLYRTPLPRFPYVLKIPLQLDAFKGYTVVSASQPCLCFTPTSVYMYGMPSGLLDYPSWIVYHTHSIHSLLLVSSVSFVCKHPFADLYYDRFANVGYAQEFYVYVANLRSRADGCGMYGSMFSFAIVCTIIHMYRMYSTAGICHCRILVFSSHGK